jgi:aromatic-L-amino-acid decarboxylase
MREFDIAPAEFERYGRRVVDWISRYLDRTGDFPVSPARMKPGELVDALPPAAPEEGEPLDRVLEDFERLVVPAINHWNHPRFNAYFSVSASGPGILGEMLASAINTNGMLWVSCPASVELEIVVLGWLRQWIRLPGSFFGQIFDTASISTLHAIAAARQAADPTARDEGAPPGRVVYASEFAHSSVEKAVMSLGMGRKSFRKVGVDAEFRMRPELLAGMIEADLAAGRKPVCVVSTAGTTAVTSVDPIARVQEIAARHGLWHHIDAAYGGVAATLEENSWMLDGAAGADSLVINPHKWLFTPIDFSAFYCRRPDILKDAFSLVPSYLTTDADPRAVNLMDYGIPLGRRFRALKLWFIMRAFGRRKVSEIVRTHIGWARELGSEIAADGRFEISAPVTMSLVCFRHRGGDEINRRIVERVNQSGVAFLAGHVLNGAYGLRIAIGNIGTSREDVWRVWSAVREAAN